MTNTVWGPALIAAGILGCATAEATRPQDMGAAKHDDAAREAEKAATQHRSDYDPGAWSVRQCPGPVHGERLAPCWSSAKNPTAWHLGEERRLRELAAKHRAASEALRHAEAQACGRLDGVDRDLSPFWRREDIASVSPIVQRRRPGYGDDPRTLGAAVLFHPVPGLTAEWLQALADCHIARSAALGYAQPETAFCPIAVPGARVQVKSAGSAFVVLIESADPGVAVEIARRAAALAPRR